MGIYQGWQQSFGDIRYFFGRLQRARIQVRIHFRWSYGNTPGLPLFPPFAVITTNGVHILFAGHTNGLPPTHTALAVHVGKSNMHIKFSAGNSCTRMSNLLWLLYSGLNNDAIIFHVQN